MSRLLLVGWDAADWKVIDPLLAKGEMPHLARLLESGVRGNLATIHPALSPMLWTSIATGKRPAKHGILGFTEPTSDGLSVRPISNLGRKTKALWNIAHQNGLRSIVAGWWPSHPAEPIRGAMVSDLFPFKHGAPATQPMLIGAVAPASIAPRLAELRVHATEISGAILRLFVPEWTKVDQDKDHSLVDLAGIIAETMSIHAAATELMETEAWDLAAIYFSGIDHFSHRFMRYHAGKRIRSEETDPALFADIVQSGYRYHDIMLGRLMALAGDDCAVMLVSDHGFHSDRLLPDYIPAEAAGPAVEHRPFGIFCLRAPDVRAGERVYGASILDVAPTALHLLGLPAGEDMDGHVLVNAFHHACARKPVASWDAIEGEAGRHPPQEQYDATAAAESLQQLVALGYVAPPGEDAKEAVENCLREQRYNLARALADEGRPDLAVPVLRELIAGDKEEGRLYTTLAYCLLGLRDYAGCRRLLEKFDAAVAEFAPRAIEELKKRRAEKPDTKLDDDDARGRNRREMFERRQLGEKANGFRVERLHLRCQLALAGRAAEQKARARALLEELAKIRGLPPGMRMFLAQGFASLKDDERALDQIQRVRRADPDNWHAPAVEARIHMNAHRYERAVDCAVESLALIYFQPDLHHLLGMALLALGDKEKAEQELRVALLQAPAFPAALEALGRLVRLDYERIGEASLLLARAAELRRRAGKRRTERMAALEALPQEPAPSAGPAAFERTDIELPADRSEVVIIVAGLPRSGTSMMMQALAAGGVAVFTDSKRLPDEDNPRGYLEHEQATRLHEDASWIPEARGKAVKIVAHLLPYLPAKQKYRLIFMHRNLDEVVASQQAMLERLGRPGGKLAEARLKRVYTQQLVQVQTWLQRQPQIAVLAAQYSEAIADPAATAARLARFLGEPFDQREAAAAIEPALQRQRAGAARSDTSVAAAV